MTMHVALRPVSGLLLLGALLLRLSTTTAARPDPVMPAALTLAERLDSLAAELDRDRIDLHVPGAALAIVRGDEVIVARRFGVADVEKKTPATPNTPFFIGSATKAFTATLVGMAGRFSISADGHDRLRRVLVFGRVNVDQETGDVRPDQRTMSDADGGVIAVATTYGDDREVAGMRLLHRYVEFTEMTGRTIYQVDRVEVGAKLAPDTFTLKPFTASGRGR